MNNNKKEPRPFDGELKVGFFEIFILGVLFFLVSWGIYHFGVWLIG